jgi:hypothetical protein
MILRVVRFLFLALIAVFLAAPLLIVTGVSFNGTARMSFPPSHPSFLWYGTFFADKGWMSAFTPSLGVAAGAAEDVLRTVLRPIVLLMSCRTRACTLATHRCNQRTNTGQCEPRAVDTFATTQLRLLIQRCVGHRQPSSLNRRV